LGSSDPKLIREHVDFHQIYLMRKGAGRRHGCHSHAILVNKKKYNLEICIKKLFSKAK
jgi:hypothetical protein